MYKIFIDTSISKLTTVQLLKDETIIEEVTGDIDAASTIIGLLNTHSLALKDIDTFDANLGPGSFTGLKRGITLINVVNWTLGKVKTLGDLKVPNYGKEPNIQKSPYNNQN